MCVLRLVPFMIPQRLLKDAVRRLWGLSVNTSLMGDRKHTWNSGEGNTGSDYLIFPGHGTYLPSAHQAGTGVTQGAKIKHRDAGLKPFAVQSGRLLYGSASAGSFMTWRRHIRVTSIRPTQTRT